MGLTEISKFLSLILRHKPEVIGISLDEHGWAIEKSGLLAKGRLYVHLSGDAETARRVGQRHGKAVIYKVLAGKMWEDGYTFYRSVNGVWLTEEVLVRYLGREKAGCRAC